MSTRHMILIGWVLFTLSAAAYIIASVGNFWAMLGSVCFFVACLFFLAAYFKESR